MAAWLCAGVLALVFWVQTPGAPRSPTRPTLALQCAIGLLLAALWANAWGLLQYFAAVPAGWDWLPPSQPGVAMGPLRQRNQQASLLSLGLWALWWVVGLSAQGLGGQGKVGRRSGGSWFAVGLGLLLAWALALLTVGSAATASRTGLVQWLVLLVLLGFWRKSLGWLPLALACAGVLLYACAAWLLPQWLLQWTGFQAESLWGRFGEAPGCTSRRVLWANVVYLIGQKPWLGWGWGELDYAHYVTLFPGARFCALLDNAHNLPLHLAVELGLPLALLLCGAVLVWVWRAKPWAETDPARQLAWGILAVVGVHSMLEFPLWYGPFQVVTLLALYLLWRRPALWPRFALPGWLVGGLCGAALALWLALAWQYHRVSQMYLPAEQRMPAMRADPLSQVRGSGLFTDSIAFAELTTLPVNRETAERVHALALRMLHHSPEPRVVERLIESAVLLGRDGEAAFHLQRYRAAYPKDHARWAARQRASLDGVADVLATPSSSSR